jgi:hypothetical protein
MLSMEVRGPVDETAQGPRRSVRMLLIGQLTRAHTRILLLFPSISLMLRTTFARYVRILPKSQSMLCMNTVCLNETNRA